jgi:ketosteroid isomerase-like protein
MTRSNDNLELILFGWLDALRRRDPARIVAHLADDIVWQGLRSDLVCPNRDAVVDNIRSGGQHRRRVSSLEVTGVDDQHVLLAVRLPGVTELYGETIAGEIFSVFKLRDEVIVRIDEFKTRDEALDALATATALDEPDQSNRGDPTSTRVAVQRAMVERVVPILNVSTLPRASPGSKSLGGAKALSGTRPRRRSAAGSAQWNRTGWRSSSAVAAKAAAAGARTR